jgi:F-type H+-transporting ATPase subunit b
MDQTLQTLGIYWPKLIAQMINFAIVLFVLWKWAYRPVLQLLAERRERIAESVANADKIKAELARTEAARREILDKANIQANKEIVEARAAAARVLETETQKAIAAAEQIIAKAREASEADRNRMVAELRREIGQLVVKATAQVTGKILTMEDQKRLAEETNKQIAA